MKPVNIAFLWHMHQPCYADGVTNEITLPWVRLHGVKSYYDMPLVQEEFPQIKATFNIVPCLIDQIKRYEGDGPHDLFYEHSIKPASDLSLQDKIFLLRYFFTCNWDTMIEPYYDYNVLLEKRGTDTRREVLERKTKRFSTQDFLDLQCWFNLTWFGFKSLENKAGLKELIAKSRNFTEEDKTFILKTQLEILRELPDIYKRLQDNGQIEVSTSPYYHPILPLLINSESARRSIPSAVLPGPFSFPEDASSQIYLGLDLYKRTFGREPKGMWPSEGSVSPEAADMMREAGIRWIATDQGVLERSIDGFKGRDDIYRPYTLNTPSGDIDIFFRDLTLSNLISFTYHKQSVTDAVAGFFSYMENLAKKTALKEPVCSVILDGENPWEYYRDKGQSFLRDIFKVISESSDLKTSTMTEIADNYSEKGKLFKLHSGSWINHNFDVWIGRPNTNKAWELLTRTREIMMQALYSRNYTSDIKERAYRELYKAEGSDWFWWFSDYFYTDNGEEFDRLFRTHLIQIHKLLDLGVPWELQTPISSFSATSRPTSPKGLMSPVLDGKVTNFYEWANAGKFEIHKVGSFMYEGKNYLKSIHYGFDLENLYIRFDPNGPLLNGNSSDIHFILNLIGSNYYRICLPFTERPKSFTLLEGTERRAFSPKGEFNTLGVNKIYEISIPFKEIEARQGQTLRFFITVMSDQIELQSYPRGDYLSFEVPGSDFDDTMWMV